MKLFFTVQKYPERILLLCVSVWFIVMEVIAWAQYHFFLYDALDLSIYTQVLWNSAHGHVFEYTFNNYSYLADHREWILLALVPVFAVWQHPLTLVAVQLIALASTVYPLRTIVLHVFGQSLRSRWIAVGVGALLLIHPSIQNMALYEFHALIFVVPLSAWLWSAFLQKKWLMVVIASVLLCAVREDVGLMLACAAVVMCIQSTTKKERMAAVLLAFFGAIFAIVMIVLGGKWFPGGSEKFLIFYPQLGSTIHEVVAKMIYEPYNAFAPLWQYDHVWIPVLFVSSVAGLCVLAPLYLLPALPQLVLLGLIPKPMLTGAFASHYAAPIVVWCIIATVYGLKKISAVRSRQVLRYGLLSCVFLISMHALLMGGLFFSLSRVLAGTSIADTQTVWDVVRRVAPSDSVLASHTLMTPLSTRAQLYPMLQVFTGKDHYAATSYVLPQDVDWVMWHPRDMVEMTLNFPFADVAGGWTRIEQIVAENNLVRVVYTPDLVVYGHGEATIVNTQSDSEENYGVFLDSVFVRYCHASRNTQLILQCVFESYAGQSAGDVHALVQWLNAEGRVMQDQWVAIVDDTLRPSHAWVDGDIVPVSIPLQEVPGATEINMTLVLVTQQEKKIFLSRSTVDLSVFPYVTLDLTPVLVE